MPPVKLITAKSPAKISYYDRSDIFAATPAHRIKPDPKKVSLEDAASTVALAGSENFLEWVNSAVRKGRRDRYYAKLANNPAARRVVTEGDSWHMFPVPFIDDIVQRLSYEKSLAVFSTDGAGDTLDEIWAERLESNKGFQKSIAIEKPASFLVNGGGNDLLHAILGPDGKPIGKLYFHLNEYKSGMTAEQLLKPSINAELDKVEAQIRAIIGNALNFANIKRVVYHGYAYPFPANDQWLGKPMSRRKITNVTIQRKICVLLLDRLHERLGAIAATFASTNRVTYVDLRAALPAKSHWHDELHPNDKGFKIVTSLIRPFI